MKEGPDRDAVERSLKQTQCFAIWENEGLFRNHREGKEPMEESSFQSNGGQEGSEMVRMETHLKTASREGSGMGPKISNFFEVSGVQQLEAALQISPQNKVTQINSTPNQNNQEENNGPQKFGPEKSKNFKFNFSWADLVEMEEEEGSNDEIGSPLSLGLSPGRMDSPRLNSPALDQLILASNESNSPEPEEVLSLEMTQPNSQLKKGPVRELFQGSTSQTTNLSPLPPTLTNLTTINPLSSTQTQTIPDIHSLPNQTIPDIFSLPNHTVNPQPNRNRQPLTNGKGKGLTMPKQTCATQTLHRSARINGRSPQTKFYKRKVNTNKRESSGGLKNWCSRRLKRLR